MVNETPSTARTTPVEKPSPPRRTRKCLVRLDTSSNRGASRLSRGAPSGGGVWGAMSVDRTAGTPLSEPPAIGSKALQQGSTLYVPPKQVQGQPLTVPVK